MTATTEKYGYTGLANLGNTCFLNSCVQVLNHTYEFEFIFRNFDTITSNRTLPDTDIIREFRELRTLMFSNNGVVSPNKFVHIVHSLANAKGRDIFTGWAQNDLSEFLYFIVECMHNCISRGISVEITGTSKHILDDLAINCYKMLQTIYSKEYSEIMDLFYGVSVSEIWNVEKTIRHTINPETYFILDLPISSDNTNKPKTLYDCFDAYTKYETITGENAWLNETTQQKEDIKKHITFWSFPKVLVITLKRFCPDGETKNGELVDFPIDNLDLSPYVSGYNPKSYVYELYGICNHMGGIHGGHYTAFVKKNANQWVDFNDTNVSTIPSISQLITPMAYCLFYRKKNTNV
jgi:ubiquitin carboxyl-terminal hydrolase 8